MRRKLSKINDLHRTHRAPPNDERRTTNDGRRNPKTPGSRGAHLSFVRPMRRRLTPNRNAMNRLPLCLHNARFLGLLRHSCVGNPHSPSHNPQPTSRTACAKIGFHAAPHPSSPHPMAGGHLTNVCEPRLVSPPRFRRAFLLVYTWIWTSANSAA